MFNGYTDETCEFFMAIRFNNNREFFQANRDWYLRAVREPSLALAEELQCVIEKLDENLERRPNRVVSRINRDVRFSKDKSPYRDYIWLAFRKPGEERHSTLGVYFDLSCEGASCGMGFYDENRPLMSALRRRLDICPEEFLELWRRLEGDFKLYPKSVKRMKIPETVPPEAKVWYNLKGFYIERELLDFSLLKSPRLVETLKENFLKTKPMYDYLNALPLDKGGNL